jgi:ferredoxin-NADP reductase
MRPAIGGKNRRGSALDHPARLLMSEYETHDVKRLIVSKPVGLQYQPGQGVAVAIDREGWRENSHPFTPTSHTDDEVLEFLIKRYPGHDNVTTRLHALRAGDGLLVSEPFGQLTYRGPGVFIAGGAGVTPFIAILRELARQGALAQQMLICSHKTPDDVICERELRNALGPRFVVTCTRGSGRGYEERRIDREVLGEKIPDLGGFFYVCGPPAFDKDIRGYLEALGADGGRIVR